MQGRLARAASHMQNDFKYRHHFNVASYTRYLLQVAAILSSSRQKLLLPHIRHYSIWSANAAHRTSAQARNDLRISTSAPLLWYTVDWASQWPLMTLKLLYDTTVLRQDLKSTCKAYKWANKQIGPFLLWTWNINQISLRCKINHTFQLRENRQLSQADSTKQELNPTSCSKICLT